MRDACIAEGFNDSSEIVCTTFQTTTFDATLCATDIQTQNNLNTECNSAYGVQANANPEAAYPYPNRTVTNAVLHNGSTTLPAAGTCSPAPAGTALASVDYTLHSHPCTRVADGTCDPIADVAVARGIDESLLFHPS
jgi:hypothetical protein